MDVSAYLKHRTDTIRAVLEMPVSVPATLDRSLLLVGSLCIAASLAGEVWAARALSDPGVFARASNVLLCTIVAGLCMLLVACLANLVLARTVVQSGAGLRAQILARMIRADATLAAQV